MRSLRELEAEFIRYGVGIADKGHGRPLPDGTIQWGGFEVHTEVFVDSLADAQGIRFLCPICFEKNGGPIGTHLIGISFADRGVPDDRGSHGHENVPTRWQIVGGSGLDDLQLSPSILLTSGCGWHGFIGTSGIAPGHAG